MGRKKNENLFSLTDFDLLKLKIILIKKQLDFIENYSSNADQIFYFSPTEI